MVSLMSDNNFKITANVPEVDVAKLSVGEEADVTLDAYGADVPFNAVVDLIDPAETVIQGVSTYKVTLRFVKKDERIRSGMTANIDIKTAKKEDVLYLPARSVITKDGKKYVKIPNGLTETLETEVTVGLRGSDGSIEILSGLNEGDTIVTFEQI
jgi:HlyD family secretion protein